MKDKRVKETLEDGRKSIYGTAMRFQSKQPTVREMTGDPQPISAAHPHLKSGRSFHFTHLIKFIYKIMTMTLQKIIHRNESSRSMA